MVFAFTLIGCTAQPTLVELETEAMATGDWSHFDRRNRRNVIRAAYADLAATCDARGRIVFCETRTTMSINDCQCGRRR